MKLDIILRTHDQASVHGRDVDWPKKEIVHRSARSLFKAIEDLDVDLTIVDDHSSQETLDLFSPPGEQPRHVINLEGTGNNASLTKVFELAAESEADAVYLVEDDYLHYPYAISEMMETWEYFVKQLDMKDICLTTVDCPMDYDGSSMGRNGSLANIVGGVKRAWRSNTHTGGTFMTTPAVINKYWGAFDDLCKNWPKVDENTTWNKIWENHVPLFTPLSPLAYHLSAIHPFYPFDDLWKKNKSNKVQLL